MNFYLDTSVIVSAFTNETGTTESRRFLRESASRPLVVSAWTDVELASAIWAKVGRGVIDAANADLVLRGIEVFIADSATRVPVGPPEFDNATVFARRRPGLRAGDALHLAIAASHEATVVTMDRGMASAGAALGLTHELV